MSCPKLKGGKMHKRIKKLKHSYPKIDVKPSGKLDKKMKKIVKKGL